MIALNRTKKEIIHYLIAENEGVHSFGRVTTYMRAFRGTFKPEMPFSFYFLSEMQPVMYVYDPRPSEKRSTREAFHQQCTIKKPKIMEITSFFEYLTEHQYIRRIYRGLRGRPELPEDYVKVWRRYSDFYNDVMSGLSFVCLAEFTPKLKLYKIWEHINKPAVALINREPR
ncbi:hypothetical protein Holit_01978 [Hollandina sp. SP2]